MDIHLDTSWCPVCDRQILPKRYLVPVTPPAPPPPSPVLPQHQQQQQQQQHSQTSVKQSQTTRGKHGTIKARVQGGGLLHGTGRLRPGAILRRDSSHTIVNANANGNTSSQQQTNARNRSPQKRQQQQQQQNIAELHFAQDANNLRTPPTQSASQPTRQRTVIDQSQTPLYCSEECRRADMNFDFSPSDPIPIPGATSRIAPHPAHLNPAQASPPPPSPVYPRVPQNSFREVDTYHSDSSSSASTSETCFSTSSGASHHTNIFTDPAVPPPVAAHHPSAPVSKEKKNTNPQRDSYDGGIMMAARRLQDLVAGSSSSSSERMKAEKEARERESAKGPKGAGIESLKKAAGKAPEQNKSSGAGSECYGPSNSNSQMGWASTHRNPISVATSPISPTSPVKSSAPYPRGMPSRAQSALELYAKNPFFSRMMSSSYSNAGSASVSGASRQRSRSRASLSSIPTTSLSFTAAYGETSSRASVRSGDKVADEEDQRRIRASVSETGVRSLGRGDEHCTWLFDGQHRLSTKHEEPASILPKGAEGKLLVPNVKLKPINTSPFQPASYPSSSSLAETGRTASASSLNRLRRNSSDVSFSGGIVVGRRGSSSGRTSALGSVKEHGIWNVPAPLSAAAQSNTNTNNSATDGGSEDESQSSVGVGGGEERKMKKSKSSNGKRRTSASGLSLPERGRLNMEARTWSYENINVPTYEVMPPVPVPQRRIEEVFVPDEPTLADLTTPPVILISSIHERDEEIDRKEVREMGKRRGEHEGRKGWWVEKEWIVTAIPERKRLFLFGRSGSKH